MQDDIEIEAVREAIAAACPSIARGQLWEAELTAMAKAAIQALDAHREDPSSTGSGTREGAALRAMAEGRGPT